MKIQLAFNLSTFVRGFSWLDGFALFLGPLLIQFGGEDEYE